MDAPQQTPHPVRPLLEMLQTGRGQQQYLTAARAAESEAEYRGLLPWYPYVKSLKKGALALCLEGSVKGLKGLRNLRIEIRKEVRRAASGTISHDCVLATAPRTVWHTARLQSPWQSISRLGLPAGRAATTE